MPGKLVRIEFETGLYSCLDFVHHTGRHREKGEGDYKDTLLVVYITSESASTTFDVFHLT